MGLGTGMGRRILPVLVFVALLCNGAHAAFNRYSFPKDFIFGTGSAAYQDEGAVNDGGKGPSVWDTFSHIPGKILNGDTGDVADDFYHRYKEDVNLLKDMNLDSFRFSIAWTRILPNGSLSGVNKEGVAFYNSLINEVIAKGLTPFVTIFHWDTPQALESKYGGFLSENIVLYTTYYTTYYAISVPPPNALEMSYEGDNRANYTGFRNGKPIGPQAYTPILFIYPPGIRELLLYTKRKYNNPAIYVMENGVDEGNNSTLPISEALKDDARVNYHYKHLLFLNLAIKEKVNIKGYFSWTFMDCFEWGDGYKDRFGLIFVDRNTLKRYRKKSSYWLANFLKK